MRSRSWLVFVSLAMVVGTVAAGTFYHHRTAGQAEVRTVTERVAAAVARGDQEALASEPLLRDRPDTVAWLMENRPALEGGYRIAVSRNGAGGHHLLSPESVSHLGVIQTPSGDLTLGFRYDRDTGRLEFVTAASSQVTPQ